ncbi:MAG: phage tail protein, partial [Hyphomicrobiaceae bacterium]
RSSVEPRKVVYGEARVSGPLVFVDVPGPANGNVFAVVPLAHTPCQEIGPVFLNDAWERYTVAGEGPTEGVAIYKQNGTNGPFQVYGGDASTGIGLYSVYRHTGDDDQAADAYLMEHVSDGRWTANHRLRGIPYIGLRFLSDPGTWRGGLPNVAALVRGRRLYDPRQSTVTITGSDPGSPALFHTSGSHNLSAGMRVWIKGHADAVPKVEGEYQVATVPSSSSFTLLTSYRTPPVGETLALTTGGTAGSLSIMRWSDNAALCVLDYLLSPFGFNCGLDEIDTASFIAAANVCDEFVSLTETQAEFTADSDSDVMTRGVEPAVPIRRGDRVRVSSTDTLPSGLSAGTDYYYIPLTPKIHINQTATPDEACGFPEALRFQLATSLANARAGTAIDFSSAGSGTHTITRRAQPRYTANGFVTLDQSRVENLEKLLSACAGMASKTGATWSLRVGAYQSPSNVALCEFDLRGGIQLRRNLPQAEKFNTVRGTFVDPDNAWQPTDFPALYSAAFKEADSGEEIARDVELPFTNDTTMAQRLAKIALLRARTGGFTLDLPCNLRALRFAAGETILADFRDGLQSLGIENEAFLVTGWRLGGDETGFGIDLQLSAESSADYSWTAGEAEAPSAPRRLKTIDSTFAQPPGLMLVADTVETAEGDLVPRLTATLSAPADQFIAGYQVEYRESGATDWIALGYGAPSVYRTTAVAFGTAYEARARSINAAGAFSNWSEAVAVEIPSGGTGATWSDLTGDFSTYTDKFSEVV